MTSYVFAWVNITLPAGINVKITYFRTKIYANVCFLKFYVIILISQTLYNSINH